MHARCNGRRSTPWTVCALTRTQRQFRTVDYSFPICLCRILGNISDTLHCGELRRKTTAVNFVTSVMSRPVNTIVFPLVRSTPGR
jgi:hypothetical protein